MKKVLLVIIVILFVFLGRSFAYIEDKVFCTISADSIIVTLNRENNYKCSDYIAVLTQAINKEYKSILAIQKLIKQKYDIDFWKNIRETKRAQIKKMLVIRKRIRDSVLEFEKNLFNKTKEYILYIVEPYKAKYEKLLKPLNELEDGVHLNFKVRTKIELMQEQLDVISKMFLAEDFEVLMEHFKKYIYLKNKIEGK